MVLANAPTLYEYYTTGGISSGLSVDQSYFTLNGKNVSIHSGAMHYFRIPKAYWRDRLKKLRAAGLNTVETYVPWNLHEPQEGLYDFGEGGTDFEDFLNVQEFLQMAHDEDLFAIVRPGPYICAEWEGGGLPSWLLRNTNGVRTSEPAYMRFVRQYFSVLLPLLAALQFMNGGPIIAFQVENEYASSPVRDLEYIRSLVGIFKENGIKELLVSSDGASYGTDGSIQELLFQTVNFGGDPNGSLNALSEFQPGKPYMVMEYWDGWFDHWSEVHHTVSNADFRTTYETILAYPASVNLYMFHGGTNWGFLNGANKDGPGKYQPTTTSYDYDAPLSEAGDYTDKYETVRELLKKYSQVEILTPDPPELVPRVAYSSVSINSTLPLTNLLEQAIEIFVVGDLMFPMEYLLINNNSGQSYGYIVYQTEAAINKSALLTITGYVKDSVMVLVNGELISKVLGSSSDLDDFGYWRTENSSITLTDEDLQNATIQLVVENWGRVNFDHIEDSLKGLTESVFLNDDIIYEWKIYPLEFKIKWNNNLTGWISGLKPQSGPALYKGILVIEDEDPKDTYINMENWNTGIVIVNGFVLGRYCFIGPQQTLYLPGPFLKSGENEILIFEHFSPLDNIEFTTDPIFANN